MEGDGASAWISDRASTKDGATQQETEPQKHQEAAPWSGRDQHRSDSPDPTGEGSPTPLGTSSQRPPRHPHDSDSDHNDEDEDDDDDDADSILDLVNPSQAVYRPHGSSLRDLGGLDDLGVEGIGAERSLDEAVKGVAVKEVGASPRRDVRDGGYGDAKVDDGDEDDEVDEEVDLYRAGPQGAGGKEEVQGWTADRGGVTEALRDASCVRAPPSPQGPPLVPGAPPLSQLPSAVDALLSDLTGSPGPSAPPGPPGLPDLFPCAPPHSSSSSSSAPLGYREVPIVLESGPSLPPAASVVGGLREISVTFESSSTLDYDDDDDDGDDDDDKVGDVLKLQRDRGTAFDTAVTAATAATARDSEDDDDDDDDDIEVEDDHTKGYAVQETAAPSSLASSYTVPYSSFRARGDHEDDDDDDDDDDDGDNIHEGGARGASGSPLDGRASDLVEPLTLPASSLPPPPSSPSSTVPAASSPPYVLIGPGRAQPAQQNKPWQPHEDPWSELTSDFQTQPQQQQQQQQPAPWDEDDDDDDEDEEEEDEDARAARGGTLPLEEEVYPAVFFSASGAASAAAPSHEGDLVASGVAGSGPGRACEPHTFLLSNGGSDTSTSSDESGSSEASIGSVVRARGRRGVDGEGGRWRRGGGRRGGRR
uniref:Uncharacterized protein LOC116947066 isoform X2 n=1 Tax=Petromyzon marinus TaxID=7757 RepID=A0AAJ7TJ55_PETMA|nr:uncharacterized protein LOC116947066 isoform X2 [Petromyzon marinus]